MHRALCLRRQSRRTRRDRALRHRAHPELRTRRTRSTPCARLHVPVLDRAGPEQQLVGQRGLAVVNVRDNGKVPYALRALHGNLARLAGQLGRGRGRRGRAGRAAPAPARPRQRRPARRACGAAAQLAPCRPHGRLARLLSHACPLLPHSHLLPRGCRRGPAKRTAPAWACRSHSVPQWCKIYVRLARRTQRTPASSGAQAGLQRCHDKAPDDKSECNCRAACDRPPPRAAREYDRGREGLGEDH